MFSVLFLKAIANPGADLGYRRILLVLVMGFGFSGYLLPGTPGFLRH